MTLRVLCEKCGGSRRAIVEHQFRECPDCRGVGYRYVEAVQLPEGRCVVVNGGKVYEAEAVGTFEHGRPPLSEPQFQPPDGGDRRDLCGGDLIAVGLKEVGK
jgi:hypothetical protein